MTELEKFSIEEFLEINTSTTVQDGESAPEAISYDNLKEALRKLSARNIVFSELAPKGKIIGMIKNQDFIGSTRPAWAHEIPDYYVCRKEDYNEAEYLYHCQRLGVEP